MKPGPVAEAEGVKLARQLQDDGILRAYGKARQVIMRGIIMAVQHISDASQQ